MFCGKNDVRGVVALKFEGLNRGQCCRDYLNLLHAGSRFCQSLKSCLKAFELGLICVVPSFLGTSSGMRTEWDLLL